MIWDIEHGGRSLCTKEDVKTTSVDYFGSLYKQKEAHVS